MGFKLKILKHTMFVFILYTALVISHNYYIVDSLYPEIIISVVSLYSVASRW